MDEFLMILELERVVLIFYLSLSSIQR